MAYRWLTWVVLAIAPLANAADISSPHGLGLLAGRASDADAAAVERLRAGLRDPQPDTRAAAVRVVNTAGIGSLVPAVREALAREDDPGAGGEMVRFLAVLARPELDADVFAAAARLGAAVHLELADGLGRRGASAYQHLPALRALGVDGRALAAFHRVATAGGVFGPASAPILRERDARSWRALLASAREAGKEVDAGLLVAAVGSDAPAMRVVTCWHLALDRRNAPAPSVLLAAFPEAPEASADRDPEERRACEYARRALGRAPGASVAGRAEGNWELAALIPSDPGLDTRLRELATPAERDAARQGKPRDRQAEDMLEHPRRERTTHARTVAELPRGFVADVLAATGCRLEETQFVRGGRVLFRSDGRPREVPGFPGAKKCEEATRALIAASLAPLGEPARPDEPVFLLVPDRSNILLPAVAPEDRRAREEPVAVGAAWTIEEPKKIRNVNPEFPRLAKQEMRGGKVVLEAVISTTGEVSGLRVVEHASHDIDLAAVGAVGGWRYTPVRLNGRPVPVLMTVTVNFIFSGNSPSGLREDDPYR
jgi:TonB family protein